MRRSRTQLSFLQPLKKAKIINNFTNQERIYTIELTPEMIEQLKTVGATVSNLNHHEGLNVINVRFKPSDLYINEQYYELRKNNPVYKLSRYNFTYYKNEFGSFHKQKGFEFLEGSDDNEQQDVVLKTKKHITEPKEVQITYLHEAICKGLTKHLRKIYGVKKVRRELGTGYGSNRIDIAVRESNRIIFFEIKTYNTVKTSLREAIG